ncbi:DUF1835 domain-containing protein [Algoriphagus namhaensis]
MIVHVLNGDALAERFPHSIIGEKIILRECLCIGPVQHQSLEELFLTRHEYLKSLEPNSDYADLVISEITKLQTIPQDTEVYFWFEEDLFCQINFWFSVFLASQRTHKLHLVLPHTSMEYGFAALNEEGLVQAWRKSMVLSQNEVEVIGKLWELFTASKPRQALSLAQSVAERLPFLSPAIQAWMTTRTDNQDDNPKSLLVKISEELDTDDFGKIYKAFHKQYPIYGYGDLIVRRLWDEVNQM